MKVVQKKMLALLLVFSLVLAVAPVVAVGAVSEDKDSYEVRYAYTMNTYDSAEKMQTFTAWYQNETGEYFYPEYFAGFQMLEDGKLAFLVTDDSDTVKNTVKSIVGEDVSFIKVEHSFNELYRAEEKLWESDFAKANTSLKTSLNLQENVVDVFMDEEELEQAVISYSESSLFHVQSMLEWETKRKEDPKGIQPLTEEELHPIALETEERAVTTVYPGVKTSFLGYDKETNTYNDYNGTTGFCALDGNGNRIIVTHGHKIVKDKDFSVLISGAYKVVGKSTDVYYENPNTMKDFAIIHLNSGIKISNKINNSGLRITGNVSSDYALESYNGTIGYGYGANKGERQGTLSTIRDVVQTVLYLKNSTLYQGDSGCPIYFKVQKDSSSLHTATLVGIFKGIDGNSGEKWGCTLQTIKDTYDLYVFQNNVDY